MTDWADEEAARFVSAAKSQPVWQDELATALRAAERRGRIAGLKEAAEMFRGAMTCSCTANLQSLEALRTRANTLEASE